MILTDKTSIPNQFNQFFGSVGQKLASKIPKSKKSFLSYLGPESEHIFLLNAVSEADVLLIISDLDISKSSGPSVINTNFLR